MKYFLKGIFGPCSAASGQILGWPVDFDNCGFEL